MLESNEDIFKFASQLSHRLDTKDPHLSINEIKAQTGLMNVCQKALMIDIFQSKINDTPLKLGNPRDKPIGKMFVKKIN